jgi:hypothetical protein
MAHQGQPLEPVHTLSGLTTSAEHHVARAAHRFHLAIDPEARLSGRISRHSLQTGLAMNRMGAHLIGVLLVLPCLPVLAQSVPWLEGANALDIVVTRRTLLDTVGNRVTPSPSGQRLATLARVGMAGTERTVTLMNLVGQKSLRRFKVPGAEQVAWSPDERRLYYASHSDRWCGILDVTSGQQTRLPGACLDVPSDINLGCVVRGSQEVSCVRSVREIRWEDDSTVVDRKKRCNLMSMECIPNAAASLEEAVHRGPVFRSVVGRRTGAGQGLYSVNLADTSFRALHTGDGVVADFAILPNRPVLIVAKRDQSIWLVDLALRPVGPTWVTVKDSINAPLYAEFFSDRRGAHDSPPSLAAAFYAPQLNPLNGRVVGANEAQLRAWVRFEALCGEHLHGRLEGLYDPVRPGDILANISRNAGGDRQIERWFVIGDGVQLSDQVPECIAQLVATNRKSMEDSLAAAAIDPKDIVLGAFDASVQGNTTDVVTFMSQEGLKSTRILCAGGAAGCLRSHYGRRGSNQSRSAETLTLRANRASVRLTTTWQGTKGSVQSRAPICQIYRLSPSKAGWRIDSFDAPRNCQ